MVPGGTVNPGREEMAAGRESVAEKKKIAGLYLPRVKRKWAQD